MTHAIRSDRGDSYPAAAFYEPIAIIGVGCRFPGEVDSPEALWRLLVAGVDAVDEVPPDRWDAETYYDPEPGVPGRTVSKWGGFLHQIGVFDPGFYGISGAEAEAMDPQHRLLLEMSWEALENAGIAPSSLTGSRTGVFVGISYHDYLLISWNASRVLSPYSMLGNAPSVAAGRIAYLLGVHGPAVAVDTACSSSLVAVHQACQSLRSRESNIALAGGVTVILNPETAAAFSGWGMLSPRGRCRAFDAGADGFVRSEGCGVIVLKRLSDAVAEGDRVLAVVRGSAINQDGRSQGITAPSGLAQQDVQRRALATAGIEPSRIGLVEAHGTGTPVGDPIEFSAIAAVYGPGSERCAVGSLKTNLGHTEAASGVAGLIKAVLALRAGVVPANLHFTGWHPEIDAENTRLFVPTELTPWPVTTGPRLAAVSSYGFSGTNAHVVLEQAPQQVSVCGDKAAIQAGGLGVVPVSASSPEGLAGTAARLADWLEDGGVKVTLADVAYTLARRREHRSQRAAVVTASRQELVDSLRSLAAGQARGNVALGVVRSSGRGPVWVFSGQGSQWSGMGSALLTHEPAFRTAIATLEPLVAAETGWSLRATLESTEVVTGIATVQPVLFAMQIALAQVWRAHGVEPAAVIGHSMGEVAAAVVAGGLPLADGVRVICRRSRLMARLAGAGAMASVDLPAAEVEAELAASGSADVVVAVISSPCSTVVAGPAECVHRLVAGWEHRELMARTIAVDVASHTAQIDPILAELNSVLTELEPARPQIPFYSTVLPDPQTTPTFDAAYWSDNLRRPVRFADAVLTALADGHRVFIEVSPHPLLTHAIGEAAAHRDRAVVALPTLRRCDDAHLALWTALAEAYCAGVEVDWRHDYPSGELVDSPLAVRHGQHMLINADAAARTTHAAGHHPLLGTHLRTPEQEATHLWQADVGTGPLPWMGDHQVGDIPVLPGAAYAEMALSAATRLFGDAAAVEVTDIEFQRALLLDEHTMVVTTAVPDGDQRAHFEVHSETSEDGWVVHTVATLRSVQAVERPQALDVAALLSTHPEPIDPETFYAMLRASGVHEGPCFAGLTAIHTAAPGILTLVAEVRIPAQVRAEARNFLIHPVLLDSCVQTLAAHPAGAEVAGPGRLMLPVGIRALRLFGDPQRARYCLARLKRRSHLGIEADLQLLSEDGTVIVHLGGVRFARAMGKDADWHYHNGRLLTIGWNEVGCGDPPALADGNWVVLTEDQCVTGEDNLADELASELRGRGGACELMSSPLGQLGEGALTTVLTQRLADGKLGGVVVLAGSAQSTTDQADLARAEQQVRRLLAVVRTMVDARIGELPRLWILTRDAQPVLGEDGLNLEQSALRALCRVIGHEHPELRTTYVDLDARTDPCDLTAELLADRAEDEVAWRNGRRYVAQLRVTGLSDEERHRIDGAFGQDGIGLAISQPGNLDSLELVCQPREQPAPGEVEIRVHAASLNFADVLNALGVYKTVDGSEVPLGADCAGVVTAVGHGVSCYRPGDRVAAVCLQAARASGQQTGRPPYKGALSSFVTLPATALMSMPDGMELEQGAALPAVYLTAWYGLRHLARLRAGEHVLIHSATGGVGLAAITIARAIGAEIYTTAGSEAKRQYLRELGIAHVMDSRSLDFADQIRHATGGVGVDVILNSLVGPAQRAGLELLRIGGRFIELGKRDIYAETRISLSPFRRNITFASVDLGLIGGKQPELVAGMLAEIGAELAAGRLAPLPYMVYPLSEAATAFRTLAAGKHVGKLVLAWPQKGPARAVVPPNQVPVVRHDGAYIITGGLGGLGLILARWLAEAGVGRLILNGRSAPSAEAEEILAKLRAGGTEIEVVLGDIAADGTAARVVQAATVSRMSLRGILHAAAVVEDSTVIRITDELLERVWRPKVLGAWRLHEATVGHGLDWWFGFSSGSALLGFPGQGAYAAANSWLDGFTTWRRSQSLPAISVGWGAWSEHGRGAAFQQLGYAMITPEEGIDACDLLLRYDRPRTGYIPIHGAQWLQMFPATFSRSFLDGLRQHTERKAQDTEADALALAELRAADPQSRPAVLENYLTDWVCAILRCDHASIDPERSLSEVGMDSLSALEFRTRLEKGLGLRVPTKVLWSHGSPATLTRYLLNRLDLDT